MSTAALPRYFREIFQKAKKFYGKPNKTSHAFAVACVVGGTATISAYLYKHKVHHKIFHRQNEGPKSRSSELRFIKFASAQFSGQIFMTPVDFLESILEMNPRKRHKRVELTEADMESYKTSTPSATELSKNFFRSIRSKGIISYTDYLFLLSILTKPISGFKIAFKMYDLDGSGEIDKNEYLELEKVFRSNWKTQRGLPDDDTFGLRRRHKIDTTLMIHFFGPDGDKNLNYTTFQNFMVDLQNEVLEIEFAQFSHGLNTISEVDFAKILLRYTYLDTDDYEEYIDRLLDRFEDNVRGLKMVGITYEEFRSFILFLNNLNDFLLAMKMYTLMNIPITKGEFQKAVSLCTGDSFSEHLVNTIFAIFDVNGDGFLSCREFLFVMKDRLHRGYRKMYVQTGWRAFKTCLHKEIKYRELQQHNVD